MRNAYKLMREEDKKAKVLAKYQGNLVLFEVAKAKGADGKGSCPECGGKKFEKSQSPYASNWVECCTEGCGFAIDGGSYDRAIDLFNHPTLEVDDMPKRAYRF